MAVRGTKDSQCEHGLQVDNGFCWICENKQNTPRKGIPRTMHVFFWWKWLKPRGATDLVQFNCSGWWLKKIGEFSAIYIVGKCMTYSSEVRVNPDYYSHTVLFYPDLLVPWTSKNPTIQFHTFTVCWFNRFLFAQESIFGFTLQGTVSDVQRDWRRPYLGAQDSQGGAQDSWEELRIPNPNHQILCKLNPNQWMTWGWRFGSVSSVSIYLSDPQNYFCWRSNLAFEVSVILGEF